jgi:hypothetical protein
MSSRVNSSVKLHQESEQNTYPNPLQTPQQSFSKQDSALPSQHKSGMKTPQRQESISRAKVSIKSFLNIPPREPSYAFNFITMGRFQIDSTITRVRVFTWLLLLSIKIVSLLTATAFWLATIIFIKNLSEWDGPLKILYFTLRYLGGSPPVDNLLRHIFFGTGYLSGPHLRLAVHTSNYINSPAIYSTSIPILHSNPFVWLFIMTFMFISHYLTCFAHDCLSKVSPTITPAN